MLSIESLLSAILVCVSALQEIHDFFLSEIACLWTCPGSTSAATFRVTFGAMGDKAR